MGQEHDKKAERHKICIRCKKKKKKGWNFTSVLRPPKLLGLFFLL